MTPAAKYTALAAELEERIRRAGFEGGKVPPVRELAESHGVSVVTVTRALQILRDKGLVQSLERSGCFVVPRLAPASERWGLCLHVTPGPYQQAARATNQIGFDELARTAPHEFDTGLIDPDASPATLRTQAQAAVTAGVKGVFLLPARMSATAAASDEAVLAACRNEGLAVVLLERNLYGDTRPLAADLVASDDAAGGRELTRHLIDQGRRRIAFVTGSPTSSHVDRLSGYLYATHTAGLPPLVYTLDPTLPPRDSYPHLCDEVLAAGADAVVAFIDYVAFGLILELLRRGVSVPGKVAVAGFDDLPIGQQFAIGVTTYAFPSVASAVQAVAVMKARLANPEKPPVKYVVPGKLIVRESTTERGEPA